MIFIKTYRRGERLPELESGQVLVNDLNGHDDLYEGDEDDAKLFCERAPNFEQFDMLGCSVVAELNYPYINLVKEDEI